MTSNNTKSDFFTKLTKLICLVFFFIPFIFLKGNFLNAEYLSEELQIGSSTKKEEDSSVIPTNPFEIVEMIRRYNSLNDATSPSDAIDDALKTFTNMEEK